MVFFLGRWLLTAAHCIPGSEVHPKYYHVRAGNFSSWKTMFQFLHFSMSRCSFPSTIWPLRTGRWGPSQGSSSGTQNLERTRPSITILLWWNLRFERKFTQKQKKYTYVFPTINSEACEVLRYCEACGPSLLRRWDIWRSWGYRGGLGWEESVMEFDFCLWLYSNVHPFLHAGRTTANFSDCSTKHSDIPLKASVDVTGDCKDSPHNPEEITDNMVCAYAQGRDACLGDSGG